MPRRNQREQYEPLDMTPPPYRPPVERPQPRAINPFAALERPPRKTQGEIEGERAERQRQARMKQGIDWSVCIVPGCGNELVWLFGREAHRPGRRDPSLELPMCLRHMGVMWRQMVRDYTADPKFIEAIADVNDRIAARVTNEEAEAKDRRRAQVHGTLYFIRIGELVKVGWTSDLWSRLKSYGASAQLVVSYPGTRDDETNLHRQLRPASSLWEAKAICIEAIRELTGIPAADVAFDFDNED